MAGNFWWIFSGLRFPRNEARKFGEKFGEKFGAKFGAKSGTKIWKIRGTFVLQLFWPNNIEKKQAFNTEWNFQSRMVISFRAPLRLQKNKARDWNLQARMKFQTENENFKREWKCRAWGIGFACVLPNSEPHTIRNLLHRLSLNFPQGKMDLLYVSWGPTFLRDTPEPWQLKGPRPLTDNETIRRTRKGNEPPPLRPREPMVR